MIAASHGHEGRRLHVEPPGREPCRSGACAKAMAYKGVKPESAVAAGESGTAAQRQFRLPDPAVIVATTKLVQWAPITYRPGPDNCTLHLISAGSPERSPSGKRAVVFAPPTRSQHHRPSLVRGARSGDGNAKTHTDRVRCGWRCLSSCTTPVVENFGHAICKNKLTYSRSQSKCADGGENQSDDGCSLGSA